MAEYHFPPIDLLEESKEYSSFTDLRYVGEMKEKIAGMFAAFKMDVKVVDSGNNAYSVLLKLQLGKNVTPKMIRNLRNDIEVALDGNPVDFMDDADGKVSCNLMVSREAMRHWAAQFASVVRVVSPPELAEEIREEIRKAAKNYDMK